MGYLKAFSRWYCFSSAKPANYGIFPIIKDLKSSQPALNQFPELHRFLGTAPQSDQPHVTVSALAEGRRSVSDLKFAPQRYAFRSHQAFVPVFC